MPAPRSTKSKATSGDVADQSFAEAMQVFRDASHAVWSDDRVWQELEATPDRRRLVWPADETVGTRLQRFVAQRFNEEAVVVVGLCSDAYRPTHDEDPRLQLVLRVVERAAQAGLRAMLREFGGTRLTGHGQFLKATKRALVDDAIRSGRPRHEAFAELEELYDIPRATAYRLAAELVKAKAPRR